MKQLVGQVCVHCGQQIRSVLDSRYCETCGAATHRSCAQPQAGREAGSCPDCGASPAALQGTVEARQAVLDGIERRRQAAASAAAEAAGGGPRGVTRFPPGLGAVLAGWLLVLFGSVALPLVQETTAFNLAWLGNGMLALASAAVVLMATRHPQGVLATGVALAVVVLPLPLQLDDGGAGSALAWERLGGRAGRVSFGWPAWLALFAAAGLLVVGGVLGLRRGDRPAGDGSAARAESAAPPDLGGV